MRVHSDIAVSEIINRAGRDLVARERTAVCFGDRRRSVKVEGRIRNVDRTCDNAIELIRILHFTEIDIFGLRSSEEVFVVGLEVDNAVLELQELIGTCAHGLCGLGADNAQIALGESEGVILIIVLCRITVVVKRRDRNGDLIDHGSIDLGGHDAHAVIAGLLNTRDIGSGITGLDTDRKLSIAGHQSLERRTCGLRRYHCSDIAVVLFRGDHNVKSFCRSDIRVHLESPVRETCRDGILRLVISCCLAVVTDLVDERFLHRIDLRPELGLLLLGPVCEVRVVPACFQKQVEHCIHTASVGFHAFDRL